ncbi:AraC family transcriptional regulator [Maribacter stanieri]|uniref:Transcriptional regulator, AraC family n=1 Tax=Maribacter stanieri TaxID=440514 RepID=A0A1I6JHX6_9FLAO|nr:AraC family transcriptional regulator [Maribacter stanieri]SFR78542.1 transcriptional regulator, AraC family [Maribacter stanieri]|tara:strand:+ start:1660 stop:2529 length:870 start_codon:yes stop_codon:yes gene_type:complete
MKLHLLDRSSTGNTSITVSQNNYKNFLKVWHFHEELELVYIIKSTGTRFVGDSIEKFQSGEVILIGKNVPHMWLNDEAYFEENSSLTAQAVSVHFKDNFVGKEFLSLPEMQPISHLLKKAAQGIKFNNVTDNIKNELLNLSSLNPAIKITRIIEILSKLEQTQHYTLLSSNGFINTFHQTENKRLNTIYEYVYQNFHTPISSKDVAELANMNASAFSRFFKTIHRKPFTRFLNEIRIGFACKMLLENKESITSIAYACGFGNISNFNRQFRIIKNESPSSFLSQHKKHL